MTLTELNALPEADARRVLETCCGSQRWSAAVVARRPFASLGQLQTIVDEEWRKLEHRDWIEAFSHHPRIGDRAATGTARSEQSGTANAPAPMLRELERLNRIYEEKFGFVFLIFASGKSADEMLDALETRIWNRRDVELRNAVDEQAKITRLRIQKLLSSAS
jgi:2-oxo-4-hydroxy-4-carboxy-5-ureidoimidazoline decarboxylase